MGTRDKLRSRSHSLAARFVPLSFTSLCSSCCSSCFALLSLLVSSCSVSLRFAARSFSFSFLSRCSSRCSFRSRSRSHRRPVIAFCFLPIRIVILPSTYSNCSASLFSCSDHLHVLRVTENATLDAINCTVQLGFLSCRVVPGGVRFSQEGPVASHLPRGVQPVLCRAFAFQQIDCFRLLPNNCRSFIDATKTKPRRKVRGSSRRNARNAQRTPINRMAPLEKPTNSSKSAARSKDVDVFQVQGLNDPTCASVKSLWHARSW